MEVFLVPLGPERYELYCEASPDQDPAAEPTGESGQRKGYIARLRQQFSEVMSAAERDRAQRASGEVEAPSTRWARMKAWALAWVADAIAEQRLLWYLRHQDEAQLHYPSDMAAERALAIARTALTRDRDRHLRWLGIDSVLMILSGALIILPGPNLIGYYFAFRVVGHFLSWRGARQGLDGVKWDLAPSEPLAELRRAMALGPSQRERHLVDIASRLRLDHLVTFVERVAYPSA